MSSFVSALTFSVSPLSNETANQTLGSTKKPEVPVPSETEQMRAYESQGQTVGQIAALLSIPESQVVTELGLTASSSASVTAAGTAAVSVYA